MDASMSEVLSKTATESLDFLILTIDNTSLKYLTNYFSQLGTLDTQYAVLDLTAIKSLESPAWFRNIRAELKQQNISLIGVRAPQLNLEICKSLKLPLIEKRSQAPKPLKTQQSTENLYIEKPIRTGQQIYAQNGSITATTSISPGAELVAKNDIHIYGTANGKLIAGADGNQSAKIYLNSGYPELISIAGITLLADSISPIKKSCYFSINNGQLKQTNL